MNIHDAQARCEFILDQAGLPRVHWSKTMSQFSKGMKQRVKLAQSLMHQPNLLVLDEPMNGLDPMGRQEVAHVLKTLAAEGVSILISSHILSELEALCRNIVILNWGRVLASGDQKEIRGDLKDWSEELSIQCDAPEQLARHLFDAGVLLGFDLEGAELLHIRVKDAAEFYRRWTGLLLESGVRVEGIRSRSRSLKNIFEKVTT
jgi:ABC-2 type transport system ATP-binding protein